MKSTHARTTTPAHDPKTSRVWSRLTQALTACALAIGLMAGIAGTAAATDWGHIEIPDQGYASCNSSQNTLAMTAYAAPYADGQYMSARFSYVDQNTGRWSTSNWTNPLFVPPTSVYGGTGGTSQIGYWTVNGIHGHTYQAWVQIARHTGSGWTYDSWVRARHLTNLQATHTNAYGQAIGNLSSYNSSNCAIL